MQPLSARLSTSTADLATVARGSLCERRSSVPKAHLKKPIVLQIRWYQTHVVYAGVATADEHGQGRDSLRCHRPPTIRNERHAGICEWRTSSRPVSCQDCAPETTRRTIF